MENVELNFVIDVFPFLGYLSGLLSLTYLITKKMNQRPKFLFHQYGSSSVIEKKDNNEMLIIKYDGLLMNQSTLPNSITEVTYTVWDENSNYKSLSNGLILGKYKDYKDKREKNLPILFQPKEAKRITFTALVQITGTHNKEIVNAKKQVSPGSPFVISKYVYEIGFRDVRRIFFDKKGKVRSQQIMDLWWTLPNTFNSLKKGNPLPYLKHMIKILFSWFLFKTKTIKHFLGF